MDDEGMGLIGMLISGVMGLVTLVGAAGGAMYAADTTVEAVVIDKDCASTVLGGKNDSTVTVETKMPVPGIKHTVVEFPDDKCSIVGRGNFVEYKIRSGQTTLYHREGGDCIWDSEAGIGC